MALELVGGAIVGAVIGELLKAVIDAKNKVSNFRIILASIEETLKAIIPRLDEISHLNNKLNLHQHKEMEELIGLLNNGKELVLKCSKISTFSLFKKQQYSKELLHLDNTLLRYFMTTLQLDQSRDNKEILVMVRELHHMKLAAGDHNNQSESGGNPRKDSKKVAEAVKLLVNNKDRGGISSNENESSLDDDCLQSSSSRMTVVTTMYNNSVSPNLKFRHSIESWEKGDLLGRGIFTTVYEGWANNGLCFAVKEVSLLDEGIIGQESVYELEQEISLLSQFEHKNIIQYLGTDKDEARLYIFLELMTKGSLESLYRKYNLLDSQVSAYTRQILNGLKYLHERNVVHRDITCANMLVDASGSVKLAGFGLARVTKLNNLKSCKGTSFWMAPEVVNCTNNGYGLSVDIWSLGCTVLEMFTRKHPYSHIESMQALFMIGRGELPPVPDSLPRNAQDFIYKCLQVNPDNRPTAAKLLEHSFVKRSLQANSSPACPHCNAAQH